jgi:hypothetical protein
MNIVKADPEHFNLFPEIELFQRVVNPTCPFGQLVYDRPLCCLKAGDPFMRGAIGPYCDKNDCPRDKGVSKCKPIKNICDGCPTNPKIKIHETKEGVIDELSRPPSTPEA